LEIMATKWSGVRALLAQFGVDHRP